MEPNSADNPDVSEHGELTDRSFEIRQLKEQKEKKKDEKAYVNYGTPLSKQTFLSWETQRKRKKRGRNSFKAIIAACSAAQSCPTHL